MPANTEIVLGEDSVHCVGAQSQPTPKKTRTLVLITVNLEARSFFLTKSMNSESHGYFDGVEF